MVGIFSEIINWYKGITYVILPGGADLTYPHPEFPVLCVLTGDTSIKDSILFSDQAECFCTREGLNHVLMGGITKKKLKKFANRPDTHENIYFVKLREVPEYFCDPNVLVIPFYFTYQNCETGVMHIAPWDIDGDMTTMVYQTNMDEPGSAYNRELSFQQGWFNIKALWRERGPSLSKL